MGCIPSKKPLLQQDNDKLMRENARLCQRINAIMHQNHQMQERFWEQRRQGNGEDL